MKPMIKNRWLLTQATDLSVLNGDLVARNRAGKTLISLPDNART